MERRNKDNTKNQNTCNRNFCSCAHKGGSGCSHGKCKCRQNGNVNTSEKAGSTAK